MTTTINETVTEIYREFIRQQVKREKMLEKIIADRGFTARIKRFLRNPLKTIFNRIKIIKSRKLENYLRKVNHQEAEFNLFTPSDKKFPDVKIAVYTVITGGYDDIREPFFVDDEIDYYLITDKNTQFTQGGRGVWKIIPVPDYLAGLSNVKKQRYIKLNPDEILPNKYDYSVYIDADLRITCDIKPLVYSLIDSGRKIAIHKHYQRNFTYDEAICCICLNRAALNEVNEQINKYKREGFPDNLGLFETTVIIRKSNDSDLASLMKIWWEEIKNHSHRDQLSLQYALWKSGKTADYIFSLGNNVWRNPYFMSYPHNNL